MSIQLMTLAWKSDFTTSQKMVLLSLCDNANDQGECYPSISMMVDKCSMSERSVFNQLDFLEKVGAISKQQRLGRSTIYTINSGKFTNPKPLQPLHPCNDCTPATIAPTPATIAPTPATIAPYTPATIAPITTIEPSIEPSKKQNITSQVFNLSDVPNEIVEDFSKLRKAKKSPLTKTAVDDIRREAGKAGLTMAQALTMCCARGWVGFRAEWLQSRQGSATAARVQAEPAWRREQRERTEKAVPGIAARSAGEFQKTDLQTFDVEAKNVIAIAVGR